MQVYSRDFGGIKSEGQLYNLEREYNERNRSQSQREQESARRREEENDTVREHSRLPDCAKPRGLNLDFLRDLRLDDLILIGIGILLLLDSDSENDIFVFLIAFLLMFN